MRRIACCSRDREMSFDFDEQDRVTTYNGLESCIHNSCSYDNESGTSRGDGCATDSFDEDNSSCSSSKEVSSSFSLGWLVNKGDEHGSDAWEVSKSLRHNSYAKEKPAYTIQYSDVETMKERFAKLLLGDDVTGGRKGIPAALALSNAIANLAASVFGELWKLEPLSVERKSKWRREMDWLLSPTNYMVELVPAKQNGTSGLEIMTPRIRSDIHMNLPALQKLDSMLIEMMDSMVNTEFWYAEGGSRAEGRSNNLRQSKRWWLPSPQVPNTGLSVSERKKLIHQGKVVHQIFKAAKAINGYVLLEMPVPTIVGDALPKSGKDSLGVELYRVLISQLKTAEEMMSSLDLKSEHSALETMNRVEIAIFAWKQKMSEQLSGKSPVRKSWSFTRDSISEIDKMELLLERAESLLQMLKVRFPNLPHTFLDATKIQYNKNVGHSILEAYSRVLGSLAFSILSRIGDILQEDSFSNPNSPAVTCSFSGGVNEGGVVHIRRSLMDEMNGVEDEGFCYSSESKTSGADFSDSDAKTSSVTASPCSSRVWCIGREACRSVSPTYSP